MASDSALRTVLAGPSSKVEAKCTCSPSPAAVTSSVPFQCPTSEVSFAVVAQELTMRRCFAMHLIGVKCLKSLLMLAMARRVGGVLVLGLLAAACAPGHVVQGRPYDVQVPAGAPAGPLPLLILLHGYSSSGFSQNIVFPFSNVVDSHQFLYVLVDGTRDAANKRFWNATDACCNFGRLPIDDVGFLRAVIADVEATHAVDPKRVFLVGHSNGAFMALRMACEASDVVSAVVSVAGAARFDFFSCPGPSIPVLQIHGTADDTIHYDGGVVLGAVNGNYPSAAVTTLDYATRNGCATTRTALDPLDLVGNATAETTREAYDTCPAAARVELWSIAGAGHVPPFNAAWPGLVVDWLKESTP